MAPDNQLTEETINGIYTGKERLKSNEGTRLLIQDDNFPNSEFTTGVSVFDNNTQLAEQVANDLEPGMRVSLRISVKPGPNGKYRNLLEILNRVSNPTPQVAQAPQPSGGNAPSSYGSSDDARQGRIMLQNASSWIGGAYMDWLKLGDDKAPFQVILDDIAHYATTYLNEVYWPVGVKEEEPVVEGDNIEDNPF